MPWIRKALTAVLTALVVAIVVWAWHWAVDRWFEPLDGRGLGDQAVLMILGFLMAFFGAVLAGLGLFVAGLAVSFVWFQVDELLSFFVAEWRAASKYSEPDPIVVGHELWTIKNGRWVREPVKPRRKKR